MSGIVTRFAPSPTGDLHIGGARTALFNWLFARHHGGQFLLRIEDTDRARSTPEATQAILDGLSWLGLAHDGEAVSQFAGRARHAAVAAEMLAKGQAYKCFATQEEIAAFRDAAREAGTSTLYHSPWRDADPATHPDAPFALRLKAPRVGETVIEDAVQGRVAWKNETLDDMILLRSDGTPTYMLAVVVDDHDMGVTHIIRGDDHLVNAARQKTIYDAMGWALPVFAHIPLIHGPDGKKMSKRHGATSVVEYRDMGYPAEAMRNYLARLGWSHGDDEFFTTDQAIEWFDLAGIGKAAARFDFKKLDNLSGQHIRAMEDGDVLRALTEFCANDPQHAIPAERVDALARAIPGLKERAKTWAEMRQGAEFAMVSVPIPFDEKAQEAVKSVSNGILDRLTSRLQHASWTHDALDTELRALAEQEGMKFGALAQPVRAALTGRATSPGVFHVMEALGKDESISRLQNAASRDWS